MSTLLNGSRYSPPGTRVPTELLQNAVKYERAREILFRSFGNFDSAEECKSLVSYYKKRIRQECADGC